MNDQFDDQTMQGKMQNAYKDRCNEGLYDGIQNGCKFYEQMMIKIVLGRNNYICCQNC